MWHGGGMAAWHAVPPPPPWPPGQAAWGGDARRAAMQQRLASLSAAKSLERSLASARPGHIEHRRLGECMSELHAAVGRLGPQWRVGMFGSARNGLLTRGADLDVTIYIAGNHELPSPAEALQDLQGRVWPILEENCRFQLVETITSARIPVLKLRFDGSLEVDLSCHNVEAMRNTQLLRAYAEMDPVVRDLATLVKVWAKASDVCGASQGHLTSYAFTLMVLYFLQVHPEFRMPCLPTHVFTGEGEIPRQAPVPWRCAVSLDVALKRFFEFYGCGFEWGQEVVAVRLGWRSARDGGEHSELKGCRLHRFHIEDPFLLQRNLNCVLGAQQEEQLHKAILSAAADLRSGRIPSGLGLRPRANSENESTTIGSDSGGGRGSSSEEERRARLVQSTHPRTSTCQGKPSVNQQGSTPQRAPAPVHSRTERRHPRGEAWQWLEGEASRQAARAPEPHELPTTTLGKAFGGRGHPGTFRK